MYYHVPIINQIKRILNNKNLFKQHSSKQKPKNTINDITDGQLYQNILESSDSIWFQFQQAYTLLVNTDGISVCEKSKLTIWPIYLVILTHIINEIPIEKRFLIDIFNYKKVIKTICRLTNVSGA